MNGDFEDDDFSDVSDDEGTKPKKKKRKQDKKGASKNPDQIEDSDTDDDEDEGLKAKFTADGLVYVNKHGEVVKKLSEEEEAESSGDEASEDGNVDDDSNEGPSSSAILKVGARVQGNYRAKQQFEDTEHWYDGVISKVNEDGTYNVDYDDGDFEENMDSDCIRLIEKSKDEKVAEEEVQEEEKAMKRKRDKARDKAR